MSQVLDAARERLRYLEQHLDNVQLKHRADREGMAKREAAICQDIADAVRELARLEKLEVLNG